MTTYDVTPPNVVREIAQLAERISLLESQNAKIWGQITKLQQCVRKTAGDLDGEPDLSGCWGGAD